MSEFINSLFRSNRDTIDRSDIENKSLSVSLKRCPQNHRCPVVKVCPVDAISQTGYAAPEIDMNKCVKCGKCIRYCPTRAISFE